MKKPTNKVSRREMLKLLGSVSASFPLSQVIDLAIKGQLQRAWAQAAGVSGSRYVYFTMPLAPPRWTFDMFLTPYDKVNFVANAHVGTRGVLAGGRYTDVTYATIAKFGLNVPPIWGIRVPDASGSLRPLDTLLTNLLSVRGIDVGAPGHALAQKLSFKPLGSTYTVTGLVADQGKGFPIKALSAGGPYEFASKGPISPAILPAGQGARAGDLLLSPFLTTAANAYLTKKANLSRELKAASESLDAYAYSQHDGAALVSSAKDDANAVMSGSVMALQRKWDSTFAKYQSIIRRTLNTVVIPGVNDNPVGAATRPTGAAALKYNATNNRANAPADMRAMVKATTYIEGVAEGFALAELAVTEDLCSSLAVPLLNFEGLEMNGQNYDHSSDEHSSGALTSLLLNSLRYAAIGACMLELVAALKAKGVFNQTVIHFGGEFNRAPRKDQSGSDHGYQGGTTTIISGKVNGPLVIGNIMKNFGSATYSGTWGAGANSVNGRKIDNGDLANALAVMLGLPEIVRRTPADQIIGLNASGKVVSRIGTGRQV